MITLADICEALAGRYRDADVFMDRGYLIVLNHEAGTAQRISLDRADYCHEKNRRTIACWGGDQM